jgi:SPP1 family predicted phage head-tail adaptor
MSYPPDPGQKPSRTRVRSGELIHYVTVQSPVLSTGPSGERYVSSWTPVAQRWASIEALTGRELWLARQVQSDTTHRIRFRPVAGADSSWSVLWQQRTYNFAEMPRDPVGDGEHVEVLAVLRTS